MKSVAFLSEAEPIKHAKNFDFQAGSQSAVAKTAQSKSPPKVAILLCTFNGQRFLEEQLKSYIAQTHSNWEIWASDDGSQDDTLSILESYQTQWGTARLSILSGPSEGFVANFLALTCNASIEADYYAYSDQDDVWEPEKLERAVNWLQSVPAQTPALYCSRTRVVNADNIEMGLSPLFANPPSFANALVQNIAAGNTILINSSARKIIQRSIPCIVVSHDWWMYIVISGVGGEIFYDHNPLVRYRQHKNNKVGSNKSLVSKYKRISGVLNSKYKNWNLINLAAIKNIKNLLNYDNKIILDKYIILRKSNTIKKFSILVQLKIKRQSAVENLFFYIAAIFNKI
jgi:glycosyltransferase involved in cell wall biosynthesis